MDSLVICIGTFIICFSNCNCIWEPSEVFNYNTFSDISNSNDGAIAIKAYQTHPETYPYNEKVNIGFDDNSKNEISTCDNGVVLSGVQSNVSLYMHVYIQCYVVSYCLNVL